MCWWWYHERHYRLIIKILKPDLKALILERLDDVTQESSATWNNADAGHSALCEINYTSQNEDSSVDIHKVIDLCTQLETTLKLSYAF
ncbi:malate:quinone oxidoreductase [Xanthomarina sp.]|uniref:malate:quinone oxidoreductase n=1 Tax=Xanthomarina sp. TaxID=1931211 RepID=UPI002C714C50|nr:malate:quinone oxidoreductase [Xanthomarina sp.]HLV39836.1 malate:quinone oxidoreductase [Xanthomarina sp.]